MVIRSKRENLARKGINRKTSNPIYSDRVLIFLFMRIKENPFYCYRRAIVLHTFEEGEFQSNKIKIGFDIFLVLVR